MSGPRMTSVEWARLQGERPRSAGCNAKLGEHGKVVRVPVARLTASDGSSGFGHCRATREQAQEILGQPLGALFDPATGATAMGLPFDYPLWDMAARRAGAPVYKLAARVSGKPLDCHAPGQAAPASLSVPCYDTSLYIDDLHIAEDKAAAALIAKEALQGWAHGQRAFKIKLGRGARHMELEAGTRRDIAVVRAVRQTVGADAPIMLDANNGYNLNLAKRVLAETAECRIHWLEEPFHEDRILYLDLQEWLKVQGLRVLIADGEGQASPTLLDWAREGIVNVVQYDIHGYGFTPWLALGQKLDAWGVQSAPHHYGGHIGNYTACHLAAAIEHFASVEWDEATTRGIAAPGYSISEGQVSVPAEPGFGLTLDDDVFRQAVSDGGYAVTA